MLGEIQEIKWRAVYSHFQKPDIQIPGPSWAQRIKLKALQEGPSGRRIDAGCRVEGQSVGSGLEVGSFEEKKMLRQPNDKGGGARTRAW